MTTLPMLQGLLNSGYRRCHAWIMLSRIFSPDYGIVLSPTFQTMVLIHPEDLKGLSIFDEYHRDVQLFAEIGYQRVPCICTWRIFICVPVLAPIWSVSHDILKRQ
jgi:hypothetical protein